MGGLARGGTWVAWMRAALLAALAGLWSLPEGAAAQGYRLGPQDRVLLRVYEWRPSEDAVVPWAALNGEFTVGADGALSLPFVGEVDVMGRELAELREIVAVRLATELALRDEPDVSVEVTRYRPFYVLGSVRAPGAYEWRPGLTAVQAVSLAGGVSLGSEEDGLRPEELISRRAEAGVLATEETGLVARQARLLAERDGAAEIAVPATLPETEIASAIVEREEAILDARRHALDTQVETLEGLKGFLEAETDALATQVEILDRQFESVEIELADLSQLVEEGLAVTARQTALERALLQVQSERLTAETALLRARQELSRADLAIAERRAGQSLDVSTELAQLEVVLEETRQRRAAALLRLAEAGASALAEEEGGPVVRAQIEILRPSADGLSEIPATDATPVEPGDTVRVELVVETPEAGGDGGDTGDGGI